MTEDQLLPLLGSVLVAVLTLVAKSALDRWLRRGDAEIAFRQRAFEVAASYHEDLAVDNERYRRELAEVHQLLAEARSELRGERQQLARLELELAECLEQERGTWSP